jgi:hypothetical protein
LSLTSGEAPVAVELARLPTPPDLPHLPKLSDLPKPPKARDRADDQDDELDDLPPLDGESGDSRPERDEMDDDDAGVGAEETGVSENALDDSTGDDESPDTRDLSLNDQETSWLDEAAETPDLDLGDMPLFAVRDEGENGAALDEPDERIGDDEDVGLVEGPPRVGLDSGDEGPIDEDEELRDADLPALDADDEGEPEDAGFVDDRFATNDPLGLPWAAIPWARVGAPLGVFGATAIACAGHGAVVAGRMETGDDILDGSLGDAAERGKSPLDSDGDGDDDRSQLLLVDLEGAQRRLVAAGLDGTQIVSLAASGTAEPALLAVVVRGGRAAVSTDGGGSFEFRESLRPAAEVAIASGIVWVRTRDGLLRRLHEDESPTLLPTASASGGASTGAVAITTNGSNLAGLVVQEDRRPTGILVTNAGGVTREPIPAQQARDVPEARAPALFAARGLHVAYAGRTGVVRRGADQVWRTFAWSGRVTALTFVDDAGTLLAAVYLDADDSTGLVRLDPAGNAAIVGRLGAPRDRIRYGAQGDGRAVGMACDDARGVVWIAGGFGVAAFAIAS